MKIFITGGAGLLGLNLGAELRRDHSVILGVHEWVPRLHDCQTVKVDFFDSQYTMELFQKIEPDLIIHTAGYTNVDDCEKHPALSHRINVELAENVAKGSAKCQAKLIHISTDHLFDGKSSYYSETAITSPLNEYGRSKKAAEEQVLGLNADALIIRTNFFGWGSPRKRSFSDFIIRALRESKPLNLFRDVYFTPILIARMGQLLLDLRAEKGIWNVVGETRLSKYDFGIRLATQFGLSTENIHSISLEDLELKAPRPADMSLSSEKLSGFLHESPGSVDEFLNLLSSQEASGQAAEMERAFL